VSSLRCRSYAKINLHLEVRAIRADGYHELGTLFQTVDLHDTVRLEVGPGSGQVSIQVEGEAAPEGAENLAVRAAHAFLSHWNEAWDVEIRLQKRIPVGGGLGGGSSNAATVLWGLHTLRRSAAPLAQLEALARGLGADVPFFLHGGTAWATGRGDVIQPLADLQEQEVWLITPPVQVSTAAVFSGLGELTAQPTPSSIVRLVQGDSGGRADELEGWNDLEPTALSEYPVVRQARDALAELGAAPVRLSGSGATLFAFFRSPPRVSEVTAQLPEGCRVVCSRTLRRASYAAGRIIDE